MTFLKSLTEDETRDYIAKNNLLDAITCILEQAGRPGTNSVVEFLAAQLAPIDTRLAWADLSTLERTLLRFTWEYVHRTTCPLPLHISR